MTVFSIQLPFFTAANPNPLGFLSKYLLEIILPRFEKLFRPGQHLANLFFIDVFVNSIIGDHCNFALGLMKPRLFRVRSSSVKSKMFILPFLHQ